MRAAWLAWIAVLAVAITAGAHAGGRTTATVIDVVDGDTLDVEIDGREERVRVLGIDTPETHTDTEPDEYHPQLTADHLRRWGKKASSWIRAQLEPGDEVTLTFDPREGRRGHYDRLLAYVQLRDGTDIGKALLQRGLARAYKRTEAQRKAHYIDLAQGARDNCVGLWQPLCR